MDFKEVFKDFNASKFLLFSCLLPFSVMISLRLDGSITWSMWLVFTPLWVLNFLVVLGAITGTVVWCQHPELRMERDGYADYKAMLITVGLHFTLLMFELLVCINVESGRNLWILVFTPLFFASPVAIAACIWGFRNDRSLELEAVLSANILFFIFIALRLDNFITWSWTAVFIPLWILMCLPSVGVLYYFVWTLIFCRTTYPNAERKSHMLMACTWVCIVIPLLTFQVLVAYRLDNLNHMSWTRIFFPLHISLLALIIGAFGTKGGNRWWFGIRTDFCQFLLEVVPALRTYGNISYKRPQPQPQPPASAGVVYYAHLYEAHRLPATRNVTAVARSARFDCVVPVVIIDSPD